MRPQTLGVVLLALASGLAAVWGVRSSLKRPAPVVEETVPAVVAKAPLPRGQAIDVDHVEVRAVPKSQAPAGRLASVEDATSRTPTIPMLEGEFVIEPKLLPKGARPGMASMIPPGMRAFTIQTPSFSSSLAGLIQPGDRVDVLLTITPTGPGGDAVTTSTLLQNLELLAVHTTVDADVAAKADPNGARSVTLLVTPRQAATLDLAQNKGTLHLSLRNGRDDAPAGEVAATLVDLGLPPTAPEAEPIAAAAAPAPPPPPELEPEPVVLTVRTLRGTVAGRDQITVLGRGRPGPRRGVVGASTAAATAAPAR